MTVASILAIGDELLDGRVINSNTSMLAVEVGDPEADIVAALDVVVSRADVVLVTGGIGPTGDDRTRAAVARYVGVELVEHADVWRQIRQFFADRGRAASDADRLQAWFPAGATVLPNPVGTAPGFVVAVGAKRIFVLPGVPSEARIMFDAEVAGRLSHATLHQDTLCFLGIPEGALGQILATEFREGGPVRVGITASWGFLRVTARSSCRTELEAALERIRLAGNRWFVGRGQQTLEQLVVERLLAGPTTLALAESLTGGLVSSRLCRVPGVSAALIESVVTYANASKVARLGVPAEVIAEYGAVSEACARAMVEGLIRTSGAQLGGAVTGIAGPDGGSADKPVGLVWFATSYDREVLVEQRNYGTIARQLVRERAASDMLRFLLQRLRGGASSWSLRSESN